MESLNISFCIQNHILQHSLKTTMPRLWLRYSGSSHTYLCRFQSCVWLDRCNQSSVRFLNSLFVLVCVSKWGQMWDHFSMTLSWLCQQLYNVHVTTFKTSSDFSQNKNSTRAMQKNLVVAKLILLHWINGWIIAAFFMRTNGRLQRSQIVYQKKHLTGPSPVDRLALHSVASSDMQFIIYVRTILLYIYSHRSNRLFLATLATLHTIHYTWTISALWMKDVLFSLAGLKPAF